MADTALLIALIKNMQTEMQELGLWQAQPPVPEAFDSKVPFFADTMDFTSWLQWVFMPRFTALIEGNHPLPDVCSVHPMAEEYFRHSQQYTDPLLALLKQFDDLVTTA